MSQALAHDSKHVALELHALLRDLDPSRWDPSRWDGSLAAVYDRIAALELKLSRVLRRAPVEERSNEGPATATSPTGSPPIERASLSERLSDVEQLLRDEVPADGAADAWTGYRLQLARAYERLSLSLQSWSVHVPSVRPTNYTRNVFHLTTAAVLVVVVEELLSARALWLVPLAAMSAAWSMEAMRQFNAPARRFLLWIFKTVAHPHERYRINSSTWYTTALAILGLSFEPMLCAVALAVLGAADPAAALVGRRFGRTKLVNGRSLEGSLAFTLVGTLAALSVLLIWHTDLSTRTIAAVAIGSALPAALAELLSRRIDDNLSVPLAAAAGGWVALQLMV
jgi:dolichol kinase